MALVSTNVSIDPNTPPGTEPLKQGPTRFHEIKQYILQIFGFSGAITAQFQTPFYFDTVNDPGSPIAGRVSAAAGVPATDDGLATKAYVDGKTKALTLTTSNFLDYVAGSSVPTTFLWNASTVYTLLVLETGANHGPVTVQAGMEAPIPLVHEDGTPLVAGDLAGSSIAGQPAAYAAIYDNSQVLAPISPRLILVGFVGGTLTQPLILQADPTVVLGAATKQYVDHVAGMQTPTRTPIPGVTPPPFIQNTATQIIAVPIIFPTDTGSNWLVSVDWAVFLHTNTPAADLMTYIWASDGTSTFAVCGFNSGSNNVPMQGSGISPTTHAAGTSTTLVLNGITDLTNLNVQVPLGIVPTSYPDAGYITVTLMRVSV